jgi:HD-like signal output (HDOD) protein
MTTFVPTTMWMAGIAAVLLLAAAAWGLSRWRRDRGAAIASAPAAPAPAAMPDAVGCEASATAATADAAAPSTGTPEADTELEVLRRVCGLAFAGVAAPAPGAASRAARAEAEAAAVAVLARIDAHPRYTPRRPQLLPQLTRAINDPAASAHAIAGILARDPALAGNLLRIANSAFYRRHPEPIESLQRAVALLGTEGLRRIVLAALLQPVVADDGSVFGRCAAVLWDHTVLSAQVATRAADGPARDDLDAVQLLALVYGLGSVAVVQVLRDAWAGRGEAGPSPDAVVAMLGTWSAPCARAISADWGLSLRVQQALEELQDDAGAQATSGLGRLLRASRAIAGAELEAMGIGPGSRPGQGHVASLSPA